MKKKVIYNWKTKENTKKNTIQWAMRMYKINRKGGKKENWDNENENEKVFKQKEKTFL